MEKRSQCASLRSNGKKRILATASRHVEKHRSEDRPLQNAAGRQARRYEIGKHRQECLCHGTKSASERSWNVITKELAKVGEEYGFRLVGYVVRSCAWPQGQDNR
jgi:hypothetical protein